MARTTYPSDHFKAQCEKALRGRKHVSVRGHWDGDFVGAVREVHGTAAVFAVLTAVTGELKPGAVLLIPYNRKIDFVCLDCGHSLLEHNDRLCQKPEAIAHESSAAVRAGA